MQIVTSWEILHRKRRAVELTITEEQRAAKLRELKDYEYLCLGADRMIVPTYAKLLY